MMLLHPLFLGRKLHIIVEEMSKILVVFLRKRNLDILKREHLSLTKPFLGENLLKTV